MSIKEQDCSTEKKFKSEGKNMNYKQIAEKAVECVGGIDNVISVTHCATRLRFQLKDKGLVSSEEIEAYDDFLGSLDSQGTIQIIIGPKVPIIYKEVQAMLDANIEKSAVKGSPGKQSVLDRILATISAIFTPYIPVLASAGVIKGVVAILENYHILAAESDTLAVFTGIGNALIYFFPILLAFTAAKEFKANPYIGATIGAALMEPNIANITTTGEKMNFLGLSFTAQNFASTVIPIIIAIWFFSKLEHFLTKHLSQNLQLILNPIICLIVIVPLTLMVFGPFGFMIANGIGQAYDFLLNSNAIIFNALFGAFFIYVIMLGMHWVVLPLQLAYLAEHGFEHSLAAGGMGNYALLGVCLAVLIFSKDKKEKSIAASSAFVNGLSGITEPGLYGVVIKNKKYFISLTLGGLVGGIICGATGAYVTNFAFTGLLGLPAFMSSPTAINYFIAVFASIGTSFITTIALSKQNVNLGVKNIFKTSRSSEKEV